MSKYNPGDMVNTPEGKGRISRQVDAPHIKEPVYSILIYDDKLNRLRHIFYEESTLS